jgi:hypothetical protein
MRMICPCDGENILPIEGLNQGLTKLRERPAQQGGVTGETGSGVDMLDRHQPRRWTCDDCLGRDRHPRFD